jgi:hypothetical protein
MKWCWILSKAFSASIEMIKWFLSLLLLMSCITFIYLHMLNQSKEIHLIYCHRVSVQYTHVLGDMFL